jgi:nucleotide-binding universal stress UspA family protein
MTRLPPVVASVSVEATMYQRFSRGVTMPTNILVPLDGSTFAEQALPTAVALVRDRQARLEVAIVHETDPFNGLRDTPWNSMTESMRDRYVTDKAQQLGDSIAGRVEHTLLRGDVSEAICQRARAMAADLIIMTTHGHTGLTRALVGSVADAVIRESGVPVLVLRQPDAGEPRLAFHKILILDDGSLAARQIVEAAISVSTPGTTSFTLLQIVAPYRPVPDPSLPFGYLPPPFDAAATQGRIDEAQAHLHELASEVARRSQCAVETRVIVDDDIAEAIANFAKQQTVDLIAMTTHGRGMSRLVFGSVTDRVLRSATVPMVILRPLVG